jgi:glutamate-ammonia-ligase adenylyltransferase
MEILVTLFAASPYLTAHLIGHPELIDTLVRSDSAASSRTLEQLRQTLDQELEACEDEEETLGVLRRFRTAELLRTGLDDLSGTIDDTRVFERLSALADVCLTAAADDAKRLIEQRAQRSLEGVHLAIVALGKMGAREMTYGSDLDLLFIYDDGRAGAGDDTHGLCTRWVQKIINLLQARTSDGIVYKIDARLRPSGRSGPLVCSFARFVGYHEKEAELWERQAHVRARVVYGDDEMVERVEDVIASYVYGTGLDDAGVREIDLLRRRVENEVASEGPGRVNIKTGRGGLVDIEFIAQMLQLRYGKDDASLRHAGTAPALMALRDAGVLPEDDADRLLDCYRFLRRLEARMRLERDQPVEELGTDAEALAPLALRLGFDGDDPGAALLERYERTREEVRTLYERYFAVSSVDV